MAAMNVNFLTKNGISLVINTAAGLERQFPKFKEAAVQYEQVGIKSSKLDWYDSIDQRIEWMELLTVLEAMKSTIEKGEGVLVHCAQGRSRSSTVVVAYIMWSRGLHYTDALALVQRARSMAQPNPGFESALRHLSTQFDFNQREEKT